MSQLRKRGLRIVVAWVALLALMLSSLGSAYVPLGAGNLAIGVAIAAVKSLIVFAVFMGLLRAHAMLRIVAAVGFAILMLLLGLSRFDELTRVFDPAPMQQPQQVHGEVRQATPTA